MEPDLARGDEAGQPTAESDTAEPAIKVFPRSEAAEPVRER